MIPLGGFLDSGGVGLWGILAPLGALVFSDVRTAARWYVAFVAVFLGSGIAGELLGGVSAGRPRVVHEHDARAQRRRRRHDRVHAAGAVRAPAPGRARGAARGAGEVGEPAAQHPAAVDRRQAQGRDADDRGPVQLGVDPVRRRRRLHAARRSACRRPRSSASSTTCSRHFDALAERYGVEKIKTIGDCYMVAAGVPSTAARSCPRAGADGARHARGDALGRRGRPPRPRAPDRDQLGAGRGRRHRPKAVPVRPLGRRGEHREPDGVPRHAGPDPDHAGDLRAARGRVRLRAAGHDPDQGQGRDGDVVPRRSANDAGRGRRTSSRCSDDLFPVPSGAGSW